MSDSGFTASRVKVGTVGLLCGLSDYCVHFYGSPPFNLNSCLIRALSEPLALMEKKKKATDSCNVFCNCVNTVSFCYDNDSIFHYGQRFIFFFQQYN